MKSPAFGLLGIGFSLAIWIAGGALLGDYLDGRFDTRPVLTVALLVLGMCIGFTDAIRRLREVIAAVDRERRKKGQG